MPRPVWSGAISFGLVTIPIKVLPATPLNWPRDSVSPWRPFSQHTKALHDARLITTSRRGGSVLHVATALGRELLAGNRSVAVCP
ncbi:hypothetical protein GCM10009730_64740 [Streptomyces albidochromogenes]|uniref:hypothetical protein n=1 Tax=Streptomyces albidochromogenes TaxID=329524 RepID=UPI00110F9CE0|nr:hypothetical protein [Streptomyces albidochromogenes]